MVKVLMTVSLCAALGLMLTPHMVTAIHKVESQCKGFALYYRDLCMSVMEGEN